MGQGSMGAFLELGSERDMGVGYMVVLPLLYTSASDRKGFRKEAVCVDCLRVPVSADVLVGCQSPAFRPGQYPHL